LLLAEDCRLAVGHSLFGLVVVGLTLSIPFMNELKQMCLRSLCSHTCLLLFLLASELALQSKKGPVAVATRPICIVGVVGFELTTLPLERDALTGLFKVIKISGSTTLLDSSLKFKSL
jgi:hypothetical protein